MPRNQDQLDMAAPPDVKFCHADAEFPIELDEDIEWRAQRIESTSRIYRTAKRKNEPEAHLNYKKKELYDAIKDMFRYVAHLKDKELEDHLRYIQGGEPTLRKKRAKACGELSAVNRAIHKASWDKRHGRLCA